MKTAKGKTPEEWPIVIKRGSATAKIFRTPENGRDRFTVEWYEGPVRKRLTRVDLAEASAEAKNVADTLNAGRGAALELTGVDRDSYQTAMKELKPLGIGLVTAIQEYVAAKKLGAPLISAAELYNETYKVKLPDKKVPEVYQEMLEARRKEGAGKTYQINLKSRLGAFSRDFKDYIAKVSTDDITKWLYALDLSPRSRRNHRNTIVSLFNFARDEKGYLVRERKHAAELVKAPKVKSAPIGHFSPQNFAKLLSVADKDILPFFVLGGFCGLRSVEAKRLRWEDIRWAEGQIVISAETSKQGEARRRRIAPLTTPAVAWLAGYKTKKGKVLTLDLYKRLPDYTKAAGVKWQDNVLRHSWISARHATEKDIVKVAHEAGNSPAMIRSNYDAVFTEAEGKLWFSIRPKTAKNVVPITAAA
jgi:integrase